jgi:hypothetical protein
MQRFSAGINVEIGIGKDKNRKISVSGNINQKNKCELSSDSGGLSSSEKRER